MKNTATTKLIFLSLLLVAISGVAFARIEEMGVDTTTKSLGRKVDGPTGVAWIEEMGVDTTTKSLGRKVD
ncbi:hypothetical protein CASFOL_005134 [Castilleja foliolosa]|uniref:Uncharacterized protein n=1 Tax=Castilleja foliolosa TaxID=1961234 RepID=A0ABD3E6N2_9LAMI